MSELKPCPFCGSKEVITVTDLIYEGDVGIECQDCGIQFFAPTNYSLIEDEKGYMISMWNRRLTMGDYKQTDKGIWVMAEPEPFIYPRWIIAIPIKCVRNFLKKWYWE